MYRLQASLLSTTILYWYSDRNLFILPQTCWKLNQDTNIQVFPFRGQILSETDTDRSYLTLLYTTEQLHFPISGF